MDKNKIAKWTGTVLITISCIIIAFSPYLATKWYSFLGYLLGAVIWLYYGFKEKDYSLAALNGLYILVDLYAVYLRA